jgi:hypothetical protein
VVVNDGEEAVEPEGLLLVLDNIKGKNQMQAHCC